MQIYVRVTGIRKLGHGHQSQCVLEECVEDIFYARFDTHGYHCCRKMLYSMNINVKVTRARKLGKGHPSTRHARKVY